MDVKRASTPLNLGTDLLARLDDDGNLDASRFTHEKISRKLTFLSGMARPDIPTSVSELGRRTKSLCMRHRRGLQYLLRQLAGTIDVSVYFRQSGPNRDRDESMPVGYLDVD